MITPFDSCTAIESIDMIADSADGAFAVSITRECFSDNSFRKDTVFGIADAYIVWTYACLYDDILNNHDYSPYCSYNGEIYSDEYISARVLMKCELGTKIPVTGKLFYNIPEILQNIADSLDYMIGIDCHSELMEYMKSQNLEEEFKNAIIDLQNHLTERI